MRLSAVRLRNAEGNWLMWPLHHVLACKSGKSAAAPATPTCLFPPRARSLNRSGYCGQRQTRTTSPKACWARHRRRGAGRFEVAPGLTKGVQPHGTGRLAPRAELVMRWNTNSRQSELAPAGFAHCRRRRGWLRSHQPATTDAGRYTGPGSGATLFGGQQLCRRSWSRPVVLISTVSCRRRSGDSQGSVAPGAGVPISAGRASVGSRKSRRRPIVT